ncbi:MAG: tyrosine-protein phosphatase [Acidimicrobiales bacterium]
MNSSPPAAANLTIDGVFNLRHLGGFSTPGGSHTGSDLVFRSDGLHRATEADQQKLVDLGVRRVIDLRTIGELDREGRFEHPDAGYDHVPIIEEIGELVAAIDAGVDDLLGHHYLHMIEHNSEAFADAVERIADALEHEQPVVFHCTAGKDRTGVLTALILGALEVDDESIAEDYARSSEAMTRMVEWYRRTSSMSPQEKMAQMGMDPSLASAMMKAERSTMLDFLAEMRNRYGTIENYLATEGVATPMATIANRLLVAR